MISKNAAETRTVTEAFEGKGWGKGRSRVTNRVSAACSGGC